MEKSLEQTSVYILLPQSETSQESVKAIYPSYNRHACMQSHTHTDRHTHTYIDRDKHKHIHRDKKDRPKAREEGKLTTAGRASLSCRMRKGDERCVPASFRAIQPTRPTVLRASLRSIIIPPDPFPTPDGKPAHFISASYSRPACRRK